MQFYPVSASLASEGKEGITIQSWKDWLLQLNLEKPAHNSSWRCSYIVAADMLQAPTGIIWVTSLSGRQRRRQDQQLFFPPTPACRYAGKPSQTNYSASRRNGSADEAALWMSALISSRYFLGVSLTLCVCLRSSHQCTHIKSRSAEEAAWRLDTQHLLRVQVSAGAGLESPNLSCLISVSSPVSSDFSSLAVVIAAGLVIAEWWKLDRSLSTYTRRPRWCVFSVRRPSKSLNILHHLLKKLSGWAVEETHSMQIIKVNLWAQTHPFCSTPVLSFKPVWLLFPLFGNIRWFVYMSLSHCFLSALTAPSQLRDVEADLYQAIVTQLVTQHTQSMGHLLLS